MLQFDEFYVRSTRLSSDTWVLKTFTEPEKIEDFIDET
jgi:hypothetical protein